MNTQMKDYQSDYQPTFDCIFGDPEQSRFYANSSSVGSGKTEATVMYMLRPQNITQNFIYVAPTIKLAEETADRLNKAIKASNQSPQRRVHVIHSQRVHGSQTAAASALELLINTGGSIGVTLILTTQTFLKVLPMIKQKKFWSVVLDEAFSPLGFPVYDLGRLDRDKGKAYFEELFQVDECGVVSPSPGKHGLISSIAKGDWATVGTMYKGIVELAENVMNAAIRVELVEKQGNRYLFSAWVTPDYFQGFAEVIFLAALFEETVLYKLWTTMYDVSFDEHPVIGSLVERNVHLEQGRNVSIAHLLHPEDRASRYNLTRNWLTGVPNESRYGERVIDKCVETASLIFEGKPYLLQINKWTGYHGVHKAKLSKNACLIPTTSHGLNVYQDRLAIAALAVTNPEPFQMKWLMEKTGMSADEVCRAFRIHYIYQAVGRTAIRANGNTDKVIFLVIGKDDAEFLSKLFEGSTWLGQVGCLGRYSQKPGTRLKDMPAYDVLARERKRLDMRVRRGVAGDEDLERLEEIKKLITQLKASPAI